jgi:hypothetical protein
MYAASANTQKEDARSLYIIEPASSCFAALIELRTFMASKQDELLLAARCTQATIE